MGHYETEEIDVSGLTPVQVLHKCVEKLLNKDIDALYHEVDLDWEGFYDGFHHRVLDYFKMSITAPNRLTSRVYHLCLLTVLEAYLRVRQERGGMVPVLSFRGDYAKMLQEVMARDAERAMRHEAEANE
jgi:hypothetical protein